MKQRPLQHRRRDAGPQWNCNSLRDLSNFYSVTAGQPRPRVESTLQECGIWQKVRWLSTAGGRQVPLKVGGRWKRHPSVGIGWREPACGSLHARSYAPQSLRCPMTCWSWHETSLVLCFTCKPRRLPSPPLI